MVGFEDTYTKRERGGGITRLDEREELRQTDSQICRQRGRSMEGCVDGWIGED